MLIYFPPGCLFHPICSHSMMTLWCFVNRSVGCVPSFSAIALSTSCRAPLVGLILTINLGTFARALVFGAFFFLVFAIVHTLGADYIFSGLRMQRLPLQVP